MKLDLLTNAAVVHYAIRFVSRKSNERLKSVISEDDKEESNEPCLSVLLYSNVTVLWYYYSLKRRVYSTFTLSLF